METIRLTLIFLHTVILIFGTVKLYPHLSHIPDEKNPHKRISGVIAFVTDLLCIVLYHTSSILVVWLSRRSGASVIRATGILLIGELLQATAAVIRHALDPDFQMNGEFMSSIVHDVLLVLAVVLTFRMSEQIARRRSDFMQIELFPDGVSDRTTDSRNEPAFL